jgi:integrase
VLRPDEPDRVSDTFARVIDELGFNNTGEFTEDAEGNPLPVKIQDRRQRVVFHSLRHTFASWLVMKGVPLYTVAQLMGHSTIIMTQRYSHLAPDSMRRATMEPQRILERNQQR